jgi:hypothetical protein
MKIKRSVRQEISRTSLTLAEVMRPLLAMLSMSATLVEALHLQAMVWGKAGGSPKISRRKSEPEWWIRSALRRPGCHHPHQCHQRTATGTSRAECLARVSRPIPRSPVSFINGCLPRQSAYPQAMAVGQPSRPRYQQPVSPHPTHPGDLHLTTPPAAIPAENVPVFVVGLVLAGPGIFISSWLFLA